MLFIKKGDFLIPTLQKEDGARRISDYPDILIPKQAPRFTFHTELQQYLTGKRLLFDELPFPLKEIQHHYENGFIRLHHGVLHNQGRTVCNRCNNQESHLFASFFCARCHQDCTYCRKCLMMGRVSECTPLFSWSGPAHRFPDYAIPLAWKGTLSRGQQLASKKVVQTVESRSSLLVWAVCGAGKTEVLFAGIQQALETGQRICIATPRTDVVLELSPRLKKVFPHIETSSLYSGSEDRTKNTPLTIATTHQLLRYHHAFDTIIIDEVDAFPYSIDPMLQYAAEKSCKSNGAVIYLSATPSKKMQRKVTRNQLSSVTIPARYHGKPLPEPAFEWSGNWEKALKKNKLPGNVKYWIKRHRQNERPIFLFVPDIVLLEKAAAILEMEYGKEVAGVHANDKKRKEKVADFRTGKIKILLTTTILERGVTVPNVQVGVLGAEKETFTESALVQIAGRAGRSKSCPGGDVRFFHYGKTSAMVAARDQIRRMNYRAREGGFFENE